MSGIGRPAASPKGRLVPGFVHSYTFVGSKPTDRTKVIYKYLMKKLIVSGCSFTYTNMNFIQTWPKHLENHLTEYDVINHAKGSQGNGIISRSIIYEVDNQLRSGIDHKDILVAIMWSGPDRHEYKVENPALLNYATELPEYNSNLTNFIKNKKRDWVILSAIWGEKGNKTYRHDSFVYYKHFHNLISSRIQTLEHMLRTQWYLEKNHINYFFTTYTDYVLEDAFMKDEEIRYLYDMLNLEQFLPVTSIYSWLYKNKVYLEDLPTDTKLIDHPSSRQHKEFTDRVIIPWLKNKKYI